MTAVEIVILAMIAAFLGLRLYSVLGRRAEQEEESVPARIEPKPDTVSARAAARPVSDLRPMLPGVTPAIERGLREIAAADRRFDIAAFTEGAKGAYRMILEAFWKGDKDDLAQMCDADVLAGFSAAIDARLAAGETLENRLVRIEEVTIAAASLEGDTARIAVAFAADIAAVTRDAAGQMIAGSLDDAVEVRDLWTFARKIGSADPDWMLDETDEA